MKVEDSATRNIDTPSDEPQQFSIVLGGPLYRFYLWLRLVKPPLDLLPRRVILLTLVTWLPLALLTLMEGRAFGGVKVPFFYHLAVHARFLLSLPLLIIAEPIAQKGLRITVSQFIDRSLIAAEDLPRFERALVSAFRLRNSTVPELLVLILSFTAGYFWWEQLALHSVTWYRGDGNAEQLTYAGFWYAFVSLPIYRFILFRWYYRIFIWYRFLWQVSRIALRLNALNPDHVGALGFLNNTAFALVPMLIAQTVYVSGKIGDFIFHEGAALPQFRVEIAGILVFLLLLVLFPMTFFILQLYRARRIGRREYGILATRYTNDFREKWMGAGKERGTEALLGSADVQSLADLANSSDAVRDMRLLPFNMKSIVRLGILVALPLFPLVLTMIPIEEIIDRMLKMLI